MSLFDDDDEWNNSSTNNMIEPVRVSMHLVAPSGTMYGVVEKGSKRLLVSHNLFCPSREPGIKFIKAAGVPIVGSKRQAEIELAFSDAHCATPAEIVESVGWGRYLSDSDALAFGYPDGRIFSPEGGHPEPAYPTNAVCVASAGSDASWVAEVFDIIRDQHLALFAVAATFVAPILDLTELQGNTTVMYTGPREKGKTTILDVGTSVCGPALDSRLGRYSLKFNNTMNRIEEWLPSYSDLPVNIDELSSYGTKASRSIDFRTMIHHLAGVDERGRKGDPLTPAQQTRTLIQMTSNDTADEMLGRESANAAEAVVGRLIEIAVLDDEFGAFSSIPEAYATASDFAKDIQARIGRNYGTVMPMFIPRLVQQRAEDEDRLKAGIARRMAEFAALPAVRELGPIPARVIDIFSLISAASQLAQFHHVLPRDVDFPAIVLHCLRLHLRHQIDTDPVARLQAWLRVNPVIDIRDGQRSPLTRLELRKKGAFIGRCRGETQLWMHPRLFARSFEKPHPMLQRAKRRGLLKIDGKGEDAHLTVQCGVRLGPKRQMDRLHVFMIPDLDEWLEDNDLPRARVRRRRRSS